MKKTLMIAIASSLAAVPTAAIAKNHDKGVCTSQASVFWFWRVCI